MSIKINKLLLGKEIQEYYGRNLFFQKSQEREMLKLDKKIVEQMSKVALM